jgi:hypothetical protein
VQSIAVDIERPEGGTNTCRRPDGRLLSPGDSGRIGEPVGGRRVGPHHRVDEPVSSVIVGAAAEAHAIIPDAADRWAATDRHAQV